MEAVLSSETSVLERATLRNIPEDGILHGHCHENLKSYNVNKVFQDINMWFTTNLLPLNVEKTQYMQFLTICLT
jgi:hypothetical protein